MNYTLSYVLTTYNKLDYLKVTLPDLIRNKKNDEEIVIADGGSTDGTADYLKKLFDEGKIDQFISEKDFGEAHGWNKSVLMARGKLIKTITDDDVFSFRIIEQCKNFMLKNTSTDMIGFDGYGLDLSAQKITFAKSKYLEGYKVWLKTNAPFLFCGLSFMIRKTSLSYMGLFNTKFKMIDLEYSLRISSLKTNIAFHTGTGFVNIANPNSNSVKFNNEIEIERQKVQEMYCPDDKNDAYSHIKKNIFGFLSKIKQSISHSTDSKPNIRFTDAVAESISLLDKESVAGKFEILTRQ